MEFNFIKHIPVEIKTFDSEETPVPPLVVNRKFNRTDLRTIAAINDPQQPRDASCLTSQNLPATLMDDTVKQDLAKDPLFDDVMDVIYNEVPRSVLADMMNTDNMIIRNGWSASLEPRPDAVGHPTPSQQYHTQGIGSCSDQMFSKGVGNKDLELMGGHDEVTTRSWEVKTCILSTEETGSAGHKMSSCKDQITQSAFNDLIAYLKDPGLKTGGHFDGISNNIEASSRQFGRGSETPLPPQTVVTHNHVTMATEGRATGRSRNKNSQAGHCDEALVRKREQNKKAAKKCRDKKLQSLKDLEQRVKILLQQRSDLTEVRHRLIQVQARLSQNRGGNCG
ncbi:uncharacterized protein LOC124146312 [Haliotis rufescens]|uniref:uncharacterized protein LOC124146312 n=1 Tax=Haliotis rufescens TaxID=6454 RepID=UPI00201F5C7D|nr:uncharacterized protein LOC124146312 [Haliotis rufescens]